MPDQSISSSDRGQLLETLNWELRKAGAMGTLFSQAVAERVGLNATDMESLDFLNLYGPMPAGRLAELTGLTTGAVTGVIDRLEAAGYVRRERDPKDRRRVIIQPRPERFGDFTPYYGPLYELMTNLLARYSDGELTLLLDYYTETNRVFGKEIARVRGMAEGKKTPATEEG